MADFLVARTHIRTLQFWPQSKCNRTRMLFNFHILLEFFDAGWVWTEPIWIKVKSWWQILPQHQSTYLRGRESASIEISLFIPSKCFLKKNFFWNFMKWGLKGGISIYADSGPPRYVLWCCGCICHEVLTFFQIGCGHTV